MGLAKRFPDKGCTLLGITERELGFVCSLRIAVEAVALPWVVPDLSDEDLESPMASVAGMQEAACGDDRGAFLEHDMAFHRTLFEATGSELVRPLRKPVQGMIAMTNPVDAEHALRDRRRAAMHHEAMLKAIRNKDVDRVQELNKQHIQHGLQELGISDEKQEAYASATGVLARRPQMSNGERG